MSSRLEIHGPSHQLAEIRGHQNSNINGWLKQLKLSSLETVASEQMGAGEFRVLAQKGVSP
jgi:hypothetical protein